MWMLPIVQRLPAECLTALREERITAIRDSRGIEAQHRAGLETSAREIMACHEHAPIERTKLRGATRAALSIFLNEHETVQHEVPLTGTGVPRGHRDRVGNPCRARAHAIHWDAERSGHQHGRAMGVRRVRRRHFHAGHLRRCLLDRVSPRDRVAPCLRRLLSERRLKRHHREDSDSRRYARQLKVNSREHWESRVKSHGVRLIRRAQDAADASASAGDDHRVVVVAQAFGGGGSGTGTRESMEFSRLLGRLAWAEPRSATVVASLTTMVGEHDVSAVQHS